MPFRGVEGGISGGEQNSKNQQTSDLRRTETGSNLASFWLHQVVCPSSPPPPGKEAISKDNRITPTESHRSFPNTDTKERLTNLETDIADQFLFFIDEKAFDNKYAF